MGITSLDAEPGRLVVEQLPEGLDGVGPLRLLGVVEASPSPWLRHLRLPCQPHPLLVLQIQLYFNVAVVCTLYNCTCQIVPDAAELLCTTVVQPRKLVHCPMNNGRTVENRIGRGREAEREMELNFSLLSSF